MTHPPVYPWSAFDDRRFLTSRRIPVIPEREGSGRLSIQATSEQLQQRLLSEYARISYEIVGVLKGEYAVAANGLMLFDRGGACISINFPNELNALGQMPYEQANDPYLRENREHLYAAWDNVPIVEKSAIFSHIYHSNYYHYTFEFAQKFRILRDFDVDIILLPDEMLNAPFKRDLVGRSLGGRSLLSLAHAVRVRDPLIVQTCQSNDGLDWLRGLYRSNAEPSGLKYYVRRNPAAPRAGNNIADSSAFRAFLETHDFKIIDFGNGENSLQDQINMLDGASVILSAHGAGLTNLAYLRAPLRVIEVFGPAVLSTSFMRISAALGFEHCAIISSELDDSGDIVVDRQVLEAALDA